MKEKEGNCNQAEQDPMGPSWDRPSPISSALATLRSIYIIVFDANLLICFADVKTIPPMEELLDNGEHL